MRWSGKTWDELVLRKGYDFPELTTATELSNHLEAFKPASGYGFILLTRKEFEKLHNDDFINWFDRFAPDEAQRAGHNGLLMGMEVFVAPKSDRTFNGCRLLAKENVN